MAISWFTGKSSSRYDTGISCCKNETDEGLTYMTGDLTFSEWPNIKDIFVLKVHIHKWSTHMRGWQKEFTRIALPLKLIKDQ